MLSCEAMTASVEAFARWADRLAERGLVDFTRTADEDGHEFTFRYREGAISEVACGRVEIERMD